MNFFGTKTMPPQSQDLLARQYSNPFAHNIDEEDEEGEISVIEPSSKKKQSIWGDEVQYVADGSWDAKDSEAIFDAGNCALVKINWKLVATGITGRNAKECERQFRKMFPDLYATYVEDYDALFKRTKQGIEERTKMLLARAGKDKGRLPGGSRSVGSSKLELEADEDMQWTVDGSWSEKDTEALFGAGLCALAKINWKTVATSIPGRNPKECERHFRKYFPKLLKKYYEGYEEMFKRPSNVARGSEWEDLARGSRLGER